MIVDERGMPMLVDFDWSGKEGEATYPLDLDESLGWPAGVVPLEPILKAHDLQMLEDFLGGTTV